MEETALAVISSQEVEQCIYLQEQYTSILSLMRIISTRTDLAKEFGYNDKKIETVNSDLHEIRVKIGCWWDEICHKYNITEERYSLRLDYTSRIISKSNEPANAKNL